MVGPPWDVRILLVVQDIRVDPRESRKIGYSRNRFLHEFREDLVLALELLFQEGDLPILGIAGASGAGFEGGRAVLEELLLPAVDHCGVDAVLVTQVRGGDVFEEMEPKD